MSELKKKKRIRCKIGFHKSDEDYGHSGGFGGAVISTCVHCGTTIYHNKMRWL